MATNSEKVEFPGHDGAMLAGRFDRPAGQIRAFALFAHCFSCSKDILAASRLAGRLAEHGIATLRFDFTGLGHSDGDFANTNFSSNVADLVAALTYLRQRGEAASLLIGHSLGGPAVLLAAAQNDGVRAVATINAPSDVAHVTDRFGDQLRAIEEEGAAEVFLAGRSFTIKRQFLEDVRSVRVLDAVSNLKKPVAILHSPLDAEVSIDHATHLFVAAKHPKSFISLDDADHLLTRKEHALYAADTIAAWSARYLDMDKKRLPRPKGAEGVYAVEEAGAPYTVQMTTRTHDLIADEPPGLGGADRGPTPYELLCAALASCTAITVRMVADRKQIPLTSVEMEVDHAKVAPEGGGDKMDVFTRRITLHGDLSDDQRAYLMDIADKCPVHRTLHGEVKVVSTLVGARSLQQSAASPTS